MQQQQKAVPYKTDQDIPIHTYEVLENGELKIVQTITTTSFWKPRDFITLCREHEEALKNTEFHISDEYVKKMTDQIDDINKELKILTPLREDSEVKAKASYEKMRNDGLLAGVKQRLDPKIDLDERWFGSVWIPLKDEIRELVIEKLESEEKIQLMKIIGKLKKKGIGVRK